MPGFHDRSPGKAAAIFHGNWLQFFQGKSGGSYAIEQGGEASGALGDTLLAISFTALVVSQLVIAFRVSRSFNFTPLLSFSVVLVGTCMS